MRYHPLELGQEDSPPCPDRFNDESTLVCFGCRKLILQITGEERAIVQLGLMPTGASASRGNVRWQTEDPYLPGTAIVNLRFDAVRVRNYKAGAEAGVLITVA